MLSKFREHRQKFDILQIVGKLVAKKNFFIFIAYPNRRILSAETLTKINRENIDTVGLG